jgi:hypothetical protein
MLLGVTEEDRQMIPDPLRAPRRARHRATAALVDMEMPELAVGKPGSRNRHHPGACPRRSDTQAGLALREVKSRPVQSEAPSQQLGPPLVRETCLQTAHPANGSYAMPIAFELGMLLLDPNSRGA